MAIDWLPQVPPDRLFEILSDAGASGPLRMDATLEEAGIDDVVLKLWARSIKEHCGIEVRQELLDAIGTVEQLHYAWVVLCR